MDDERDWHVAEEDYGAIYGRPLSLDHPDAPRPKPKELPPTCRQSTIFLIREWILKEQMYRVRRYGDDERLYNHQLGYLLALSNLMELLNEIEVKVNCTVLEPPDLDLEPTPDRDF